MDRIGLVTQKNHQYPIYIILDPTNHNYVEYFKNSDAKDKIIKLPRFFSLSSVDFPSFVFDDIETTNWPVKSIKR
ncbi:hypothetical protein H5410_028278 [Solanum commersonii]|uniref:Uncharacterized protein n=1 Tax=Solanum commersonii TaxID=4109 RepID=A0A9J5Z282_SOLCO|nr:hypothetical protein H5410_028278 [Solanum commersonii]